MSSPTLIDVNHLYRNFNSAAAVIDVSFSLHSGEILGFLGPNGAGKSTTLRMITGNLAPTSGQVMIGPYDLQLEPISARRMIGYLPDSPPLYRDCSVKEFLRFCGQLHGISARQLPGAINRAVERCGLDEVRDKLINHLSKGFQQRVGIAQAIIHEPPLVILDEPTVGLDPRQIDEIRTLIRELGRDHSVILSTHILSEVQAVCSHVQIINRGQLVLKSQLTELNHNLLDATHEITFRTPPPLETLNQLRLVKQASQNNKNGFVLQFHDPVRGINELLQQSLNRGWGIDQLTPPQASLEQLFMQLTEEPEIGDADHVLEASQELTR
ncbi:MAG: ATP-binding cassette domain-containing protein [Immundisolibacteraceae bacterium]|nr:ATP-binding cassette domain-containing protein [Immundisolibacteraceae bacterium]